MRTTLAIDDVVLARAKERARASGLTLGQYVESALREKLSGPPRTQRPPAVPRFTRGTGVVPGVDVTSNRGLYEALGSE